MQNIEETPKAPQADRDQQLKEEIAAIEKEMEMLKIEVSNLSEKFEGAGEESYWRERRRKEDRILQLSSRLNALKEEYGVR